MGTLAISAANLNTLENNLLALNNNINNVSGDIISINGRISSFNNEVNEIKASVKSLEQEIRDFMFEIRGTTIVSNSQNDILLKENELNKKYGSYEIVRRKISGLFESIDANVVDNATLLRESEKLILNTPNYYLSYALASICAWFNDDKITAYNALNGALKLNESKTSLLLCLVHLRLNRNETALKWMKKYLALQDPFQISSQLIYVLDSLTNSTYSSLIVNEIINSIKSYSISLKNDVDIKRSQIERWEEFFSSKVDEIKENSYPFIAKFTNNYSKIKQDVMNAQGYLKAYDEFEKLLSSVKNTSNKSFDVLLNNLVNSYEESELKLKKDILKDKLIINNEGNTKKALEKYKLSALSLNEKNDFYTILSNIVFDRNDVSLNTKKLAIGYLKDFINEAFNNALMTENNIGSTTISINNWNGETVNGENEKELIESMSTYVKSTFEKDYRNNSYFDIKVIIVFIASIIGIIVSLKLFTVGVVITVLSIAIGLILVYNISKNRDYINSECKKATENYTSILENVLAEIVDVNFTLKRSQKNKDKLINYLNSFNENDFISVKNN